MAEFVDRAVVIETIREEVRRQMSGLGLHRIHVVDMCFVEDAVMKIPAADVTRKWIPVTERLPEAFQPVYAAVRCEDGREDEDWVIEVSAYAPFPFMKSPWGRIPILESGKAEVYAWMPKDIPEPPKGEMEKT